MPDRVVIVGGGLAGLAAAVALGERGLEVTLLESRPRFGGRASSFVDQTTGEPIDNCQHVAFGCCTNFLHLCRTIGVDEFLAREDALTFVDPRGRQSALRAAPLPAPLHLAPAFARVRFLSWFQKVRLALGLRALARIDPARCRAESMLDWLRRHKQSPAVIDRFWHVVLVSALSETLDRIDVGHARKVMVDLFLRNRHGWEMWAPRVPLDRLYGVPLTRWFNQHGVTARLQAGVRQVTWTPPVSQPGTAPAVYAKGVELRTGESLPADHVIVAVPQNLVLDLLPEAWRSRSEFAGIPRLETAPISSVHLWYNQPITELRHATFVGRLSQWLFNRGLLQDAEPAGAAPGHDSGDPPGGDSPARVRGTLPAHLRPPEAPRYYYQVVISASREVVARSQEEIIQTVAGELAEIWPAARHAQLVHARLVTEHKAVISMLPGVDDLRPAQQTSIANLYLAGDWTSTGWPGTMEGAVRSGYLAAECVLANCGRPDIVLQRDLPTAALPRLLLGVS